MGIIYSLTKPPSTASSVSGFSLRLSELEHDLITSFVYGKWRTTVHAEAN